jgi:SAM-dependent methyltransferase
MSRLFHFARYFFFICVNHNLFLACRILFDEIRGERKYGLDTTGVLVIRKQKLQSANAIHSNEYMPASYVLVEDALEVINKFEHNRSFLDIGCGKGRALFVAARYGFTSIAGIEFYEPYCDFLKKQVEKQKGRYPGATISVHCADAEGFMIPDTLQTIFFYNPFNEQVMEKVIAHIRESYQRRPRNLYVIYLSPVYKSRFIEAGFREVYHDMRFGYLESSVLVRDKE